MDPKNINLVRFQVEVCCTNFMVRGEYEPRGDALVFLNDVNRDSYVFYQAKLAPMNPVFKMPAIEQAELTVAQTHIHFVSLLNEDTMGRVQMVQSKRTAVFYTDCYVIRGDLHVHGEARNDDMLENIKSFYPVSNVTVFPLRATTQAPQKHVPLLALNRTAVVTYHMYSS